jgi:hypothetical protein
MAAFKISRPIIGLRPTAQSCDSEAMLPASIARPESLNDSTTLQVRRDQS